MIEDNQLTFIMHVYQDPRHQLDWCLGQLRSIYPKSRVIVIADGIQNEEYRQVCNAHSTEYREDERLYHISQGARIWDRFLRFFLEQPSAYVFRIDPDTYIRRRFKHLPVDGIFGSVDPHYTVQGGCIGITLDRAKQLHDTKTFLRPEFDDWQYWVVPRLLYRVTKLELTSMDWTLRFACQILDIPVIPHNEISCHWVNETTTPRRYAVTHPHYVEEPDPEPVPAP